MATKKNISNKVATDLEISLDQGLEITNTFIKLIKKNAFEGQVKISNFGTFYIHKTPKRLGRNPKTKDSYIIQPRIKINFKPSNKVRGTLNWLKNFFVVLFFLAH